MGLQKVCCTEKVLAAGLKGNKFPSLGTVRYNIFVPIYQADGVTKNSIPKGTVLTEDWIKANFEAENELFWNMFPEIDGYTPTMPEAITQEINGVAIQTGFETKQPRTFRHTGDTALPFLEAAYNRYNCKEYGVLKVHRSGAISGLGDGLGNLYPEPIQGSTTKATRMDATETERAYIEVSMTPYNMNDNSMMDWIEPCNIEFDPLSWFTLSPLHIEIIPVTTALASLTFDVGALNSGFGEKFPIGELIGDDFTSDDGTTVEAVYNLTTSAVVDIALVASTTIKGRYVATYAAPVAANDEVRFRIKKEGVKSTDLITKPTA